MTESWALRALKAGDTSALEWFIDRYTGYVSAVVINIIGSGQREDIEEIVSDAFFVLWQNAGKIKASGVKGYLGRVARNKAVDFLRSQGAETLPLEEDVLVLPDYTTEDEMGKACERWVVQEAVLSMEWPEREIFLRHYFLFQPVRDIARLMDMPENTVKTHLRRGREKLKGLLEKELT